MILPLFWVAVRQLASDIYRFYSGESYPTEMTKHGQLRQGPQLLGHRQLPLVRSAKALD